MKNIKLLGLIAIIWLNAPNATAQSTHFNGDDYTFNNGVWQIYDTGSGLYFDVVSQAITIKYNSSISESDTALIESQYSLTLLRNPVMGGAIYSCSNRRWRDF